MFVGVHHYTKYARIRVFNDPHSPVCRPNARFCPTRDYKRIRVSKNVHSRIFYAAQ